MLNELGDQCALCGFNREGWQCLLNKGKALVALTYAPAFKRMMDVDSFQMSYYYKITPGY